MKTTKKFLSVLLSILMLTSMLPLSVLPVFGAETIDSGTCGENLTWTLDSEGTLTISGEGDMYDYNWDVSPFYRNPEIINVVIESGVTSIGDGAFYSCSSLTNVTIPNNVTKIGGCAFYGCGGLENIIIPDSIVNIGDDAFGYCLGLLNFTVDQNNSYYTSDANGVLFNKEKTILLNYPVGRPDTKYTIPDSVTEIAENAFHYGINLIEIIIPNSVICIGNHAFNECHSLTNITIPDSVTTIGYEVFAFCSELTSIAVTAGNQNYINDEFGVLLNKDKTLLIQYPAGNRRNKYEIPEGVITLASNSFCDAFYLEKVIIPSSITSLDYVIFQWCTRLKSIAVPDGIVRIGNSVFWGNTSLKTILIPDSVICIESGAFYECNNLTDVYFTGSEDQWNKVQIEEPENEAILSATIHYNAIPGDEEYHEHIFDDGVIIKEASCTEEGHIIYTCIICGEELTEYIAKISHTPRSPVCENETAATCTAAGRYDEVIYCTVCGAELSRKTVKVPATGHNYGAWVKLNDTQHQRVCANDPSHVEKANHTWDAGKVTKEATTVSEGIKTYTCTVCSATKTETIAKLPPKESTDKNSGITVSYTDASFTQNITLKVEKVEDVDDYLSDTYTGVTAYDITTLLGNTPVQPKAAVTVSVPIPKGYNENAIEVYHVSGNKTEKVNSTVANGKVTFTAASFSKYIIVDASTKVVYSLGDVDEDGKITSADARLALRRAVDLESYAPKTAKFLACDADGDKKISAADARLILRAAVNLENPEDWKK